MNQFELMLHRIDWSALLGATGILLVGWVIATLVRSAVKAGLARTTLDERLAARAGMQPIGKNLGDIAFWLVLLFFAAQAVGILGLTGLLLPLQGMFNSILLAIPNIIAALLIGFIGYMIAKVVKMITVTAVAALPLHKLADKAGQMDSKLGTTASLSATPVTASARPSLVNSLPNFAGNLAFLLVLIPALIAALQKLGISAISLPATNMLNKIMMAIPNALMAAILLGVFWFVARLISQIVVSLLDSTSVNELPAKMGMENAFAKTRVSQVAGHALVFFVMLFAVIEAANLLGLGQISTLVSQFIRFGADVLLGAVILMVGFWLANLLGDVVKRSNHGHAGWLGSLVKVLIMGLVIAMGLRAMGIADSIVNLAFGLTLGAVAVAFALAFGLGGRAAADRLLKQWLDKAERQPALPASASARATSAAPMPTASVPAAPVPATSVPAVTQSAPVKPVTTPATGTTTPPTDNPVNRDNTQL